MSISRSVCFLLPSLSGGGAEFVALQWASYLCETGYEVHVVTTHDEPRPTALPNGVRHTRLQASNFPARVRSVRSFLTQHPVDVLLSLMPHWNLLAVAATRGLRNRPVVLISGRNMEVGLRSIHGPNYRREMALAKLLYPKADGYIAISHPVAAEAIALHKFDPQKVWVVPNPASAKAAPSLSTKEKSPADSVTLTVPARLVPQKQPHLVVETAALIRRQEQIDVKIDFFGSGPLQGEIESLADDLSVPANFRGWDENWFDHCASDAVVLVPSAAEGFGNVFVEAAIVGVPSVAPSGALGVADAILPGVTGYLAAQATPSALAHAVESAMTLDVQARPEWVQYFGYANSGQTLMRILESALESSR
jgi:glycosyltransferase involved in cell wall biosynthesis